MEISFTEKGSHMHTTETPTRTTPWPAREQCPRWCVRHHTADDLPSDRIHDGDTARVEVAGQGTVTMGLSQPEGDLRATVELLVPTYRGTETELQLTAAQALQLAATLRKLAQETVDSE